MLRGSDRSLARLPTPGCCSANKKKRKQNPLSTRSLLLAQNIGPAGRAGSRAGAKSKERRGFERKPQWACVEAPAGRCAPKPISLYTHRTPKPTTYVMLRPGQAPWPASGYLVATSRTLQAAAFGCLRARSMLRVLNSSKCKKRSNQELHRREHTCSKRAIYYKSHWLLRVLQLRSKKRNAPMNKTSCSKKQAYV